MIALSRISGLCILVCIAVSVSILFAHIAQAACTAEFCPLADVSEVPRLSNLYATSGDLATFIGRLFFFALTIGGMLAVLRIAWGGYLYMTTDLWSKKEHAREVLRETILGFLLLLAVWLILYQINPQILDLNILKTIEGNPAPTTNSTNLGALPIIKEEKPPIFVAPSPEQISSGAPYCFYYLNENNYPVQGCLETLEACKEAAPEYGGSELTCARYPP